jgi:hypothetical protein
MKVNLYKAMNALPMLFLPENDKSIQLAKVTKSLRCCKARLVH